MNSKIHAVLFDLDGTLRDTRQIIYRSVRYAINQLGGPADVTDKQLHDYIHHHSAVHKQFLPQIDFAEFERLYFGRVFQLLPSVELYEQAEVCVAQLHQAGKKLAIVSSAGPDEIATFLDNVGLAQYFDAVIGDDGKGRRKPSADPVLRALRQLGIPAGRSIMVGDTRVDILTAQAANVRSIGITHGFDDRAELKSAGADYIIDSLVELPALIERIEQ